MPEIIFESKERQKKNEIYTVQNEHISLTFDLKCGISLTSICDKITGSEFLTAPSALFMFSVNDGWAYMSDTSNIMGIAGVKVVSARVNDNASTNSQLPDNRRTLTIKCHVKDNIPLEFEITVEIMDGDIAAVIRTSICNTGTCSLLLGFVNPCISNLTIPGYQDDPERMLGMIPQEIGGVVALHKSKSIGMIDLEPATGHPGGRNIMEVANIYDRDGKGGVFFSDVNKNRLMHGQPVQFVLGEGTVKGLWMKSCVLPGQTISAPDVAIGVNHSGDFRTAVDYYADLHSKEWSFSDIPAWFEEAGGIWSTGTIGSWGVNQEWETLDLREQIKSFEELPVLYDKALACGTGLFLLSDYWEGDKAGFPRYWCKGDYIPREDLGGEKALIQGIKGIHSKGGKVIMYLDPSRLYYDSILGKENGRDWAARLPDGNFHMLMFLYYTMLPVFEPWRKHLKALVKRLAGEYGADGVYLDSWGLNLNISNLSNIVDNRKLSFEEWNAGVYDLVEYVKGAITEIRQDAVVMCKAVGGNLWKIAHGGFSTDLSRSAFHEGNGITASPVRYGNPQVKLFSSGNTMNQLAQVFASGHSLALNCKWDKDAEFINKLLVIRKKYRDAFVFGRQIPLTTGNMQIAGYYYRGCDNTVIALVNTANEDKTVGIRLQTEEIDSPWMDLLTGEVYKAKEGILLPFASNSGSKTHGLHLLLKTIT